MRVIMGGWNEARAGFIVREHARHPRLVGQGGWRGCGCTETGQVREQAIEVILTGSDLDSRVFQVAADVSPYTPGSIRGGQHGIGCDHADGVGQRGASCGGGNPIENVWQYMRANWLSDRIFEAYDDIVDHCSDAWNKLVARP